MKSLLRSLLVFLSRLTAELAVALEEKPVARWVKKDGVIYITSPFLTNGWSGGQWRAWFEEHGYNLSDWTKDLLRSTDFVPSEPGVALWAAVVPGEYFSDANRVTSNIRTEAAKLGLTTPLVELICFIRQNFSNEEIRAMGLYWLVGMHNPITDSDGSLNLLSAGACGEDPWLYAHCVHPDLQWSAKCGFVFGASASPLD